MGKRKRLARDDADDALDQTASVDTREYYARMMDDYDETTLTQKIYAEQTENVQNWVKKLWDEFCHVIHIDPVDNLRRMPIKVLHSFFHWVLRQRSDTLRTASSLQTYWNTFGLVRRRETGLCDIDVQVKRQWQGVQQRLVDEFRLNTQKKPKPIVRAEDEFELLRTLWTSPEVRMEHERLRVQLGLIVLLAGITGNRPDAILGLRYEHVNIALLRDPDGSDLPRPIIDLTFKRTKSYMGLKDANTFGIPEVPSEPCLLLCPHALLFSLVFADEAFEAPDLTGPEQLFRLRVPSGLNQLQLPIKKSMAGVPLFRRLERNCHGLVVSDVAAATGGWLRKSVASLGNVTGFALPVGPYCFRRGNGEALDSSSLISDSQRNLILQHANSGVFQHNYLSHYITQDTQAVYRGLAPQAAVMRAASGMSRSIDQRCPRSLNDDQLAEVTRHPEVKLLQRHQKSLARRIRAQYGAVSRTKGTKIYLVYQKASRRHQNKKRAVRKAMIERIRAEYRERQPVVDILGQLNASSTKPQEGTVSAQAVSEGLSEERRRACAALFRFATSEPAEEYGRRSEAINAVTALSQRQELPVKNVCRSRQTRGSPANTGSDVEAGEHKPTSDLIAIECLPTQCIFCLGKVDLAFKLRTNVFHSRGDLKRHFERKHLRHLPDEEPIDCPHPECDAKLSDKKHLQNHAATVHKTLT